MNDAQSVALITADEGVRGGKKLRLKDTADAAVKGLILIVNHSKHKFELNQ